MADTTYATLAELKERISVPSSDVAHDAMLQQLLNAAAIQVDESTRGYRPGYEAFSVTTSETRYYNDNLRTDGMVDIDDALSVTTVTRASVDIGANYQLWPYNRGNGPATKIEFQFLVTNLNWYPLLGYRYGYPFKGVGSKQIAVTGTWGFCTAANRPAAVKEATLILATLGYTKRAIGPKEVLNAMRDPYSADVKLVKEILAPLARWGRALFG